MQFHINSSILTCIITPRPTPHFHVFYVYPFLSPFPIISIPFPIALPLPCVYCEPGGLLSCSLEMPLACHGQWQI